MKKSNKKVIKNAAVEVVEPIKSESAIMDNEVIVGHSMKVVFADVKVRGMSMNVQNKEISAEINDKNNAEKGTAKVTLRKFPESFCKPIVNAGQGVYAVYKTYGIPVGSHYAVPIANFPKFEKALKEAKSKFDAAVQTLRDAVQTGTLTEIAKVQQGSLYNPENDLTLADVDRTFVVQPMLWKNLRCPQIQEAMAILGEDTVSMIEEEHKKAIEYVKKESALAGVKKIASDIRELVDDIVKKCSKGDAKNIQWKTVVRHIQEAIQTLPAYNVTDNPIATEAIKELETKLGIAKEYELKNDEAKRKELSTGAEAIAKKFAGMFD